MSGYPPRSPGPHEELIRALAADLSPVRRLKAPMIRAVGWFAIPMIVFIGLISLYGSQSIVARLIAAPDLWMAASGAALTAVCAALAAFELSVPGSSQRWALLPLPPACLWIGASGMGCFRSWLAPDMKIAVFHETADCFSFIVGLSLPLSIALFIMLRRACPLRLGVTATMGGLACAAAAAALLSAIHPFDATVTDLAVHSVAVILVMAGCRLASGRLAWIGTH